MRRSILTSIQILLLATYTTTFSYGQFSSSSKIEAPEDIKELLAEDDEEKNIEEISIKENFTPTTNNNDYVMSFEGYSVPTRFSSTLDSMLFCYYTQYSKPSRCRQGENIEATNAEYTDRLKRLPYEIEMPFNEPVKAFIDLYTKRKRTQVETMLGMGEYYFPMFDDILEQYNIPLEFRYLPVIESALNVEATSRVGAAGLWQFMPTTGRMYGLKVNTLIDERRDPIKSTHAAARYLKDLYKIYKDWHLAIAAYNCGPGNVNRAIRRSGGKRNFWEIYAYLPAETRSYVPIFIAANYTMNYYKEHNLCPAKVAFPIYSDTVQVKEHVTLDEIAKSLQLPVEELKLLNPQYRKNIIPGNSGQYYLALPTHYSTRFIEEEDSIYARCLKNKEKINAEIKIAQQTNSSYGTRIHRVKKGETLSSIAKKYGTTVSKIKRLNNLRSTKIRIGQRLKVKRR